MKVTSTRVRNLGDDKLCAIASVTIDGELIINDIKVERHGKKLAVILPQSERARLNKQYSICPGKKLYEEIRTEILKKMEELS